MARPVLTPILLLAALGGIAAVLWHFTRTEALKVRVAGIETGMVERMVANTRAGTVKACRRARLAPGTGGQIATLDIKEGQRVEAGQILLELWNRDLAAQIELAEREAEASRSRAEAACLQAASALRESIRLATLKERGVASVEAVDKATTEARSRQAECEAAHAAARVEQARIGLARANRERTRLVAPFAGVVAQVNGELHEYVTPSPPGIPTLPAVDLIDDSCFYVAAPIDEVDAPEVRVGQEARISLDAFGDRHFAGRVRRIAPFVLDLEKQARTVEVEVEFVGDGELAALLAGYSADVEIITERRDAVLRLPTEAVLEDDQVYLLGADGLLHKHKIGKGLSNWDWTEVTEGLASGDRVVVSLAQEGLGDGVEAVADDSAKSP